MEPGEQKSVNDRVVDILVTQLGADRATVTRDTKVMLDLQADSLDIVELIMAFEEEFQLEIPDADAEKLETVGNIVDYIEPKLPKA